MGKSDARKRFSSAEYIGFDLYPGPNVDVVGDAHKLSQYFAGQQFDIIYSTAVFEHLAMPWLVAQEIAKLLKTGGIVFVETHFSYSSHERPWHFFQFSDMALKVLFSLALGIECIEAGLSNPMVARFSSLADENLRFMAVRGLYGHSAFLGRKIREVPDFNWNDLHLVKLWEAQHTLCH
jgi:SAM-dependent methyltransferase